jgi:capsular exopolysaccharide synthesis family protein
MKPVINNKRRAANDDEESSGQSLVSKYLPYWPMFILSALLALAAAHIYLRYATPIFEAGATMIVNDEEKGNAKGSIENEINRMSAKKKVENEIQVLQSRVLMETVVKKLGLYAPVMQEGKVKGADGYTLSPIKIEKLNPDSVVNVAKIYFTYDKTSKTVNINGTGKYPLNEYVTTPYGQLKFMENPYYSPAFESEKKTYFSLIDPRVVASGYALGLKVSSNRQSAIIDISYRDPIPQRAVNIIGELITAYQDASQNEATNTAKNTLTYLNERLGVLKSSIDSIEGKRQVYMAANDAINVEGSADLAMQTKAATTQKMDDIRNQDAMLSQVERSVLSSSGSDVVSPKAVQDAALAGMMSQLYTSQMEYNRMKKDMGANHPDLIAKANEINKIRPGILENIRTQRASLNAAISGLSSSAGSNSAVIRGSSKKQKDLLEINREHASRSQSFDFLQLKKQETEMALLTVAPAMKVVDKPMAGQSPVSPKKKLIYILAIVGALGLCVGVITVKDMLTGKIKYRAEIEKMTSIPIIGEIAFDKSKSPIVIEKGTRSFVAEEFRKLRISLSFLGIDSSHKKILVTSSISGEGKSFIAANLAVSLSLTGKKVVLVDMDLNNPSLSKILSVNQEYGSTELLSGEKSVDEVVKKLDEHENLYFISAGNLPENPTELLANGKINAIIDYLENSFDVVLIDTSPSVLVTDAFILSGLCDATLYVVRHDYTPKMLVKRIDENNEINPLHNPAIVFNGVKGRGIIKNNYGYGYDYVYGNKDRGSRKKKVS